MELNGSALMANFLDSSGSVQYGQVKSKRKELIRVAIPAQLLQQSAIRDVVVLLWQYEPRRVCGCRDQRCMSTDNKIKREGSALQNLTPTGLRYGVMLPQELGRSISVSRH